MKKVKTALQNNAKVLLVQPYYPDSFWSYRHALRFISKKAAMPPLGLITVSAMLPKTWEKRLVDINISSLKRRDLVWADFVFISAMYIQKESVSKIIEACLKEDVKIIAGGPLFTQEYESYPEIDHFILNEAEITLPQFLADLEKGIKPQRVYKSSKFADLSKSPIADYHLLARNKYAFMNIQISRGCPFACDFCEITSLLGHKVRMKGTQQVLNELETLYALNWRGSIFVVDDNFIGNIKEVKNNLLPALKDWMQKHKYPFTFNTQASINLADEDELMTLMIESGFNSAFIGIETPQIESLQACNKVQNKNRNLLQSVKKIQKAGILVSGGFIVGFDSDLPSIFQKQIDFIQQSGIVSAMVGLLNAPKNTKLYKRLENENRLTIEQSGNNTDLSMNFIPKMNQQDLIQGYQRIISSIYSVEPYYKRVRVMLSNYKPRNIRSGRFSINALKGFIKSIFIIGILNKGRSEYWKLIFWTLFKHPKSMVDAIEYAVYGYHYRIVFGLK